MVRIAADRSQEWQLFAGEPCLDFLNTVDWRGRAEPVEMLETYDDLIDWCRATQLLDDRQLKGLRRVSRSKSIAALARATAFREAALRLLRALQRGAKPSVRDLDLVNATIARAHARQTLRLAPDRLMWDIRDSVDADLPLHVISLSFADLVKTEDVRRVRECDGPECGWIFLDTTKNRQRRWCSMAGCGNRAKARRFYARTR